MTTLLMEALNGVCVDLERLAPECASLHFAKGVLAASASKFPILAPQALDLPEDEIIAAYQNGSSAAKIAEGLGVAYMTVARVLGRHGIDRRSKGAALYPAIAEMYEGGASILACATAFGVGQPLVRRALEARGVAVKSQGGAIGSRTKWAAARKAKIDAIMALRAEGKTLEEIGSVLRITRERVRQIVVQEGRAEEFAERPISPEQAAILEEYRNGANLTTVATKLGASHHVTKSLLTRAGIPIRPASKLMAARKSRAEFAERIVERYQAGETAADIASAVGLKSPAQIYRYLAIAGVKPTRNLGAGKPIAA